MARIAKRPKESRFTSKKFFLEIPVRDPIQELVTQESGELFPDGVTDREKQDFLPRAIQKGWSVLEISHRFGWSSRKTKDQIKEFWRERKREVKDYLEEDVIAAEVVTFSSMIMENALKNNQQRLAWSVYKDRVNLLQSIDEIRSASQKHEINVTTEERWSTNIAENGAIIQEHRIMEAEVIDDGGGDGEEGDDTGSDCEGEEENHEIGLHTGGAELVGQEDTGCEGEYRGAEEGVCENEEDS